MVRGVKDDLKMVSSHPVDDDVVHDSAVKVRHHRVLPLPIAKLGNVIGCDLFQECFYTLS